MVSLLSIVTDGSFCIERWLLLSPTGKNDFPHHLKRRFRGESYPCSGASGPSSTYLVSRFLLSLTSRHTDLNYTLLDHSHVLVHLDPIHLHRIKVSLLSLTFEHTDFCLW